MTSNANMEGTGAAEGNPAMSGKGFRFPLPFDPIRLLAGVAARWPLLATFALAGLIVGGVGGKVLTKPSFSVSSSLIKRKVPQNVQASETGQSYRPADLNDPTLLATLLAAEPLDRAVARHKNGLDSSAVHKMVEASQQKGTDIYFITYHSPIGPGDAVKFTRIWAEEITDYTKRLQQSDARGVRDILQSEVADMEKRLAAINKQILDFSREKRFLGANTQVTAALNQLGQADLELESARASLKAKDSQIESLVTELRRQSPIDAQLKAAHEEVASLRSTYTDENPLVKAKLQSIAYLEQKLKEFNAQDQASLDLYAGTPIGNQLFLDVLARKNERTEIQGKIDSYTALHASLEDRVKEYPAIVSRYQELEKSREITVASLTLFGNRLKETEIFASSAPGYWQIFEGPEDHEILRGSKLKLPLIFGIAGAVAATGLALMLVLLTKSRTERRSALECCTATGGPLLADYYDDEPGGEAMDRLWINTFSSRLYTGDTMLAWTALTDPADERAFWQNLAAAAKRDGCELPPIIDLTPDGLWEQDTPPADLRWTKELPVPPATGLFRASKLPASPAREHLSRIHYRFALANGDAECLKRAARTREFAATHLPPCAGTVAILSHPANRIRQLGDQLSRLVANQFSRPLVADSNHE